MRYVHNLLLAILLLLSTAVLQAESEHEEYLDLFEHGDVSFIVGNGEDAIAIHRVMRPCGKNKGFLQPLIPAEGVTLVSEREMLLALNDEDARIVDMRLVFLLRKFFITEAGCWFGRRLA